LVLLTAGLRLALPLADPWLVLVLLRVSSSATATTRGTGSAAAAAAAPSPSPAAAPGYVRGRRTFLPGGDRNQAVETARTPPPDQGRGPSFMLPHPVVPFEQPLFERSLDLRFGRSWFFGPDLGPVRPDCVRSRVGIRGFWLYYPFRLEIGHHLGV